MEVKTCPVCHRFRKEIKGIHIDVCDRHGVFLDRGELQHLADEFKKEGFTEEDVRKVLWRPDIS